MYSVIVSAVLSRGTGTSGSWLAIRMRGLSWRLVLGAAPGRTLLCALASPARTLCM